MSIANIFVCWAIY